MSSPTGWWRRRGAAEGDYRLVRAEDGAEYSARAVLIASGSRYKRLEIPGEKRVIGASVHYCATCDGPFYRGRAVAVIGGGPSAVEEGLFLSEFAAHVTLLVVRGPSLRASQVALAKFAEAERAGKINARFNVEVAALRGRSKLSELLVRDRASGETSVLLPAPTGLFVFVGMTPNTDFLPPEVARRERLYPDLGHARDEYAGRLRGGRRPRRQHQPGCRGCGRGGHRRPDDARLLARA